MMITRPKYPSCKRITFMAYLLFGWKEILLLLFWLLIMPNGLLTSGTFRHFFFICNLCLEILYLILLRMLIFVHTLLSAGRPLQT
jgi:hypothetical protein